MLTAPQDTAFDIARVRADFPILDQEINGRQLVYFDNAATTQKPLPVINAILNYYRADNANIHRGIHTLAERATADFEASRVAIANFLGAASPEEIIFTSGTTMGINLVAQTYGRKFIQAGDEIIISGLEHHSNIVPWQMLCEEKGITLKVIPVLDSGELDLEAYATLLSEKRSWCRLTTSPTRWARLIPSRKSSEKPTKSARWYSSTARRPPAT